MDSTPRYRSRSGERVLVFSVLWVIAALAWTAVWGVPFVDSLDEEAGTVWFYAAVFLLWAIPAGGLLGVAIRTARSRVHISSDGVDIRGPMSSRVIPINDAVAFEPAVDGDYGNGTPCPILRTSSGHLIGVWALGREALVWNFDEHLLQLQATCGDLNAALDEARAGRMPVVANASPAPPDRQGNQETPEPQDDFRSL